MIIDVLARVATATDGLKIGFFTSSNSESNRNVYYQDRKSRITFANKSFINVAFDVKKLEDCFRFAGMEFDLLWIDDSSGMTEEAILFLSTLRRSTKSPTNIILT